MKRLFYIKKDNTGEITQQVLLLGIGERHFCFAITDKNAEALYSLAYYSTEETDHETLSSIYTDHPEIGRSFHAVHISYDYARNVFVPMQHFSEGSCKTILDAMHGRNGRSAVVSDAVNEWQLYNVYDVPAEVQEWVKRKFPSATYRHQLTLGIRSMPADQPDRLLVNIHTDDFSFIATKDNKLLIAQTHLYASPEDICYYLLKTCHQFSLSQEQVQVSVSGLIEKDSQLYRELYQFFINVAFREPGWNIPANGEQEYPAHFFTTLNDLARCAL